MVTTQLTEKQKLFCTNYIITLNATESAKLSGYSGKTSRSIGAENLTKPIIQKYIYEGMSKKGNNLIATQDEILQVITSIIRKEDPRTTTRDVIRACELMGKRWGMFTNKPILHTNQPTVIIVDDL